MLVALIAGRCEMRNYHVEVEYVRCRSDTFDSAAVTIRAIVE